MTLVVRGRVTHRELRPEQVEVALRKRLPALSASGLDFSVELATCKVEFFCNVSSMLDYTITAKSTKRPAPGLVVDLARETDTLHSVLLKSLGRRYLPVQRPRVQFCRIEDNGSRSGLLRWTRENPLWSRPAKFSYCIVLILIILAFTLIRNTLHQPASTTRNDYITSLILAVCIPAFLVPLPFFFEHFKARGSGRWIFSQGEEGS